MARADSGNVELTPQEGWQTLHETMDRARSSMYVAGSATIMLLWAGIAAVGLGIHYSIATLAPDFVDSTPWIFGVLWGSLMVPGMVGSAFIGHNAGKKLAPGDAARSAGKRVFLYWLTVVLAMFVIPAGAGMWNAESGESVPGVTIGIVSLAYILFGIMHRPALAAVGAGFAAAFYVPSVILGEFSMAVSGGLMLAVVAVGAWWIRRSGVS